MATATSVDYSRLKLLCILEGPGATVLTRALKYGTRNTPPVQLNDYLNNLPPTSTANFCSLSNKDKKKKTFTSPEMKQIMGDTSWNYFDITLLYKSIRLACEHVAGLSDVKWKDENEMEGLITKIKDERNSCIHERPYMTDQEFQTKVSELEGLFVKTLEAVKVRYKVPDPEFTQVKCGLQKGIRDVLGCFTVEEIMRIDSIKLLPLFKEMAKRRLTSTYKKAQLFDPLCFLNGSPETLIHVQTVFSKITIKENVKQTETDCLDLLRLTLSLGQSLEPPRYRQLRQRSHSTPLLQSTQPTHRVQLLHLPRSIQPSHTVQPTQPSSKVYPPQPIQPVRPQLLVISGVAGSGKTTLLTFILSEWLKDSRNCQIDYLDQYDLVLRILCQERDGTSLKEFLEQVFPESVMFGTHTMPLLKKCRVLFLIDGLDEFNSSSYQLVLNILDQCKEMPEFSIMCTSRLERVADFIQSVPQNYGKLQVHIEGIARANRTEFVLKHYNSLSHNRSTNTDGLRQLMERIGWRDHLGLPLNLLFLATMFHDDPDSLKNNITQSCMYLTIHQWCVEKLQERLARNPKAAGTNRQTRKIGIMKVLKMIYQVALDSLLQDRIILSEENTKRLIEYSEAEKLPSEEMMAAFFSLRQSVANRVIHEKYYIPHKGIQEFYAAQHIVGYLQRTSDPEAGLIRRLYHRIVGCLQHNFVVETGPIMRLFQYIVGRHQQRCVQRAGAIRRLLQNSLQTKPLNVRKLKNLFLHVTGLLTQPDTLPLPGAIEEVVDLLAESGVRGCHNWLSLLEDTKVNIVVLQRVANHVTNTPRDNEIVITDSTVFSAAALLPLIPGKQVKINLRRETNMTKLSQALTGHTCKQLSLEYHYKHPGPATTSDPVLRDLCT